MNQNLLQCCYFFFTIGLCLFCRFSISLALYISTLSCYVKLHHKNGYLGNSRILGTWNLDLLRSNHRMIMLQSLQVFLLLLLLAYGFFMEYRIFEYLASFLYHCHCFLLVHLFPLSEFYCPIKCREFTYISSRACYLWGLCAQDMGWGNGQISSWFLHTRKHEDRCDIKVLHVSRYIL